LDLKRKKRLIVRLFVLLSLLLITAILLTGCVRGMTPVGWSGVAIVDGTLYTGSKEGRVVLIDTATSSKKFSQPVTTTASGGFGCGTSTRAAAIYGTPALADDLVFIAGYNGEIDAYTADNLEYRWSFPPKGQNNLKPIIGSIVISDNVLYFGCTDGNVYGLDPATGNERWRFETGGEIWSTPAIDNNTLYIGSFDRKIYAVDIATQSKKWEFPTGATNVAPPIVSDGIVYAGSLDRNIYALNANNGSLVWKFTAGSWFWAKPVIYNGVVYAPNLDNHVYGLDAKTGQVLFDYDLDGQVASWPVVIGNQVIVATENGNLFALGTDPNNPNQKQIASFENVVITSPLSAGSDAVYINGSDNQLYQVNITSGQKSTPISLSSQ
jgi:outer membrane protein assembly factor BamB